MVSSKKGIKERSEGLHRDRRARATLRNKEGSNFCRNYARDKVVLLGCLPLGPLPSFGSVQ